MTWEEESRAYLGQDLWINISDKVRGMTNACPLCANETIVTTTELLGYVEGFTYAVRECTACRASHVEPLASDEKLYDAIYRQASDMPGYERYERYARLVLTVRDPLAMLSRSESIYWAVAKMLETNVDKSGMRALEIGSGLGYLTYSLNKAGYATTGLDISAEAVAKAAMRYGDFYEAGDLFAIAPTRLAQYDCVIMTELIEHVEDPVAFIRAAVSLLKPGGILIMTTPNKDICPEGVVWQGDVPPVHLWWFSEDSLARVAQSLGKEHTFLDFTPYTSTFYEVIGSDPLSVINSYLPRMDAHYELLPKMKARSFKEKYLSEKTRQRLSYIRRRLKVKTPSKRSATMGIAIYA